MQSMAKASGIPMKRSRRRNHVSA